MSCTESVPTGATKPTVLDTFPERGMSGHAATLRIEVDHGRGEGVLSPSQKLASTERAWAALKTAGFAVPDADGGAAARLGEPVITGERAKTVLELPLIPLPPLPGRAELKLPSLPVSVSRASGEIMTVCTRPHVIRVEDPIANVAEAAPQPNPPPLPQREDWMAMRIAAIALAAALVVAAIAAYFAIRWARRPKPAPPPAPRKPPWEIALAKLADIAKSDMLARGQYREYVDSVSDALREYLGARYGFDGIESTTDEIKRSLAGAALGSVSLSTVIQFLEAADLVKFAKMLPAPADCQRMLGAAESIVRATMTAAPPTSMNPMPYPPAGPSFGPPSPGAMP